MSPKEYIYVPTTNVPLKAASMNSALSKKALLLSYFTVGYNVLEGLVSIAAGLVAGSTALVGFGLDSFVESLSAGVMVWRFRKHEGLSDEEEEKIEERAEKLVGITFLILGGYVLFEAARDLYVRQPAEPSLVGIVIAILSVIIMPFLYKGKVQVGKAIGSRSLVADAKETLACVMLSVALLVGLTANYLFGIWWTDPVAGLVIAGFLLKEGYETLTEAEEDDRT